MPDSEQPNLAPEPTQTHPVVYERTAVIAEWLMGWKKPEWSHGIVDFWIDDFSHIILIRNDIHPRTPHKLWLPYSNPSACRDIEVRIREKELVAPYMTHLMRIATGLERWHPEHEEGDFAKHDAFTNDMFSLATATCSMRAEAAYRTVVQ